MRGIVATEVGKWARAKKMLTTTMDRDFGDPSQFAEGVHPWARRRRAGPTAGIGGNLARIA
jgi:hypothetical protein